MENESAFTSFLIGTGRWFVDKKDGLCYCRLLVSNALGLTTEEVVEQYKQKMLAEYELYKRTPVGQSLAGQLGESGLLPMLIASPLITIRGGIAASMATGAIAGAIDSVINGTGEISLEKSLQLITGGAMVGVVGYGISKVGAIAYSKVVKPAAHAVVDTLDFINFNRYFQQELANVGKEIMYKRLSYLRHSVKQMKGKISEDKIHAAITGAMGEARMHKALEKVLVRKFNFKRIEAKYDSNRGFDALYIKRNAQGQLEQIVIAESKASSKDIVHGLSKDVVGIEQLSRDHIEKTFKKISDNKLSSVNVLEIQEFLSSKESWSNVKRLLAKTNGEGWTQWHEVVDGIASSKAVIKPISDELKLIQGASNTLTLKRLVAAGLIASVPPSASSKPLELSFDISVPTEKEFDSIYWFNDGNEGNEGNNVNFEFRRTVEKYFLMNKVESGEESDVWIPKIVELPPAPRMLGVEEMQRNLELQRQQIEASMKEFHAEMEKLAKQRKETADALMKNFIHSLHTGAYSQGQPVMFSNYSSSSGISQTNRNAHPSSGPTITMCTRDSAGAFTNCTRISGSGSSGVRSAFSAHANKF